MLTDDDLTFRHQFIAGGSFARAMRDRKLMQLSDTGGASGMIGDRWSDICAGQLIQDPGAFRPLGPSRLHPVTRVVRLDDIPRISATASLHSLKNPDFLVSFYTADRTTVRSADAKFSIDTARSVQVSAATLEALRALGATFQSLLPVPLDHALVEKGWFLSPDYSYTRMLLGLMGLGRRVTVPDDEIQLLDVSAEHFLHTLPHRGLLDELAVHDQFAIGPADSLLVAVYYLRLVRASVACWNDMTSPLLGPSVKREPGRAALRNALHGFGHWEAGAWNVVCAYDAQADIARGQRAVVKQVSSVPISNRDLRARVLVRAAQRSVVPPSASAVRRLVGSWFDEQLRGAFGPLDPPVPDFDRVVVRLSRYCREMRAEIDRVVGTSIEQMLDEAPTAES